MNVLIVHDEVGADASPDAADAVAQAEVVAAALAALGHDSVNISVGLDLDLARRAILDANADVAFNLVESLGGHGRLIHVIPSLLDTMGVRYTGAPADAIYQTSNKLAAKRLMRLAGVPTPMWIETDHPGGLMNDAENAEGTSSSHGQQWIIKSTWEHASIGLDEHSIVTATDESDLREEIEHRRQRLGGDAFAEKFIEGREFNLSVLAGDDAPEVLPPAEIEFRGFADNQARIVGYRAKWEAGSFEYENTPRRFTFPAADSVLLETMRAIAVRCWRLFALRGHARVDFRVDHVGRVWVLEVNANPCLSPDAGFAAALAEAGIEFSQAIDRILRDVPGAAHA